MCPILAEIVLIVLATLVPTILGKIVSMLSKILHQRISKDCFSYKVEPCIYVGWNLFTSSGWYPAEIQQNYRKPKQQKPNQIGGPIYGVCFIFHPDENGIFVQGIFFQARIDPARIEW